MARKLQTLTVYLTSNPTNFERGLRRAKRSLASFAKFAAGGVLAAGAAAGAAGAGLTAASVNSFINAQETFAKFETVFSNVGTMANAAAANLSKNYGLARTESKALLADTADLLSGFGFAQSKALEMSTAVNELAVDLASFTNFSGGAKGASLALTKALLGERESVKSLGIAITENDIKALAASKGMAKTLDRQTKAALTLELALKQSKNAIGDFARTADSPANRLRVLKARWTDIKVVLGEIAFKSLDLGNGIGSLTDGLSKFAEDLSKNSVDWIRTIRLFVNEVITSVKKTFAWVEALFTIDSQSARQKQLLREWDAKYMQKLNEDKSLSPGQRARKYNQRWGERKQYRESIGAVGSWNQLMGKLDKYNEEYTQNKIRINESAAKQKDSLRSFAQRVEDATKRLAQQKNKASLADSAGTQGGLQKAATSKKSEAVLKGSLLDYQTDIYSRKATSIPESQTAANTKKMVEVMSELGVTVKKTFDKIKKIQTSISNFNLKDLLEV